MDLLFDELFAILGTQTALYRSLLLLLHKEKEAVVESDLRNLKRINSEKHVLTSKIQALEHERLHVLEKFREVVRGSSIEELTLKRLSNLCCGRFSDQLRACRSKLSALTRQVRDANDRNSRLLTHAIDIVNSSAELLNNLIASDSIYHHNGKILKKNGIGGVFSGTV